MKNAHKDSAILKKYSSTLMSNHKWRKLYLVMAEYGSELCGIEYRFTDTDKVFVGSTPTKQQIWETAIDDPVQGAGGPVEYKHIESISIPYVFKYQAYENTPLAERTQKIEPFLEALEKVGIFPVFKHKKFIVVMGYK